MSTSNEKENKNQKTKKKQKSKEKFEGWTQGLLTFKFMILI